jgi:sigma-B regulation protein RsbU (phosphoserine phosphatase)
MRDRIYLAVFLLGAGALLYAGRGLIARSVVVTAGLTFAGTTAAGVFGLALYRVQIELRASRMELARKQAELTFAHAVQRALFPRQFPVDSGLEFSAVCVPASGISGDYYDVLQLPNGRLVFAVADISGKGISAAILMSNVQAVLRTLAEAGRSPAEVCSQLNRHLYRVTDDSWFATFFYAEWNHCNRTLTYINAGHTTPVLWGSSRGQRLDEGGVPLGIFPDSKFSVGNVELQPGDLMAVYSDGVTEAGVRRGEQFGEERLEALVTTHAREPLEEIQGRVLTEVRKWAGEEPEDDITLLLVRAKDAARRGDEDQRV